MTAEGAEPNDPTRSGSPLPSGAGAHLSHNEVEQLCLKAARGAGMAWGLAEEAGFAAAWLAARGLDGPGALLAQLRAADGSTWSEICPVVKRGGFRAREGGCLCPIALGAALCDYALLPETAMQAGDLRIGPVNHPILLLPFLSDVARTQNTDLHLVWPGGEVLLGAKGGLSGDTGALLQETTVDAALSIGDAPQETAYNATPLFVSSGTLSDLNAFALRTTVPASEASRAGAGAKAGDND